MANVFGQMIRSQRQVKQGEFWVARHDLARAQASRFYDKLQETLETLGFAAKVHALCVPLYSSGTKGRPPIDPVVYFKMLMVGFLENLPSERAIASRCGDSLMIRRFLGYALDEETPHHSSFTVIRQRLKPEVFQAVFEIILAGLRAHGLLRGQNLGLDSSVLEANASLRALENRNTGEAYWDYVRRLAAEAGVDPEDADAVQHRLAAAFRHATMDAATRAKLEQTGSDPVARRATRNGSIPTTRTRKWRRPKTARSTCYISPSTSWTWTPGRW